MNEYELAIMYLRKLPPDTLLVIGRRVFTPAQLITEIKNKTPYGEAYVNLMRRYIIWMR